MNAVFADTFYRIALTLRADLQNSSASLLWRTESHGAMVVVSGTLLT
jgi:hypothetical protein